MKNSARHLVLLSSVGLVACGGGKVDEEEAQVIFAAMYTVNTSIATEVQTQAAMQGAAKDFTFTETEDGWSFSATIEGSGLWTGTVEVDGVMSWAENDYTYAYTMQYIDVTSQGVTLNGDMDMNFAVATSDDTSFEYLYSMIGQLDATGEATGTADIDYEMQISYDATTGTYSYSLSGDIGGHDVSGYSAGSMAY